MLADQYCNGQESNIVGWPEAKVKESLANYSKGNRCAKTVKNWVLTIRNGDYLVIVECIAVPIKRNNHWFSFALIGASRCARSSLTKTLGVNVREYNLIFDRIQGVPGIVTTKYFDMLRLEPRTKYKPTFGDDMALSKISPEELKIAGNPGEEDRLMWARWGGRQHGDGADVRLCREAT